MVTTVTDVMPFIIFARLSEYISSNKDQRQSLARINKYLELARIYQFIARNKIKSCKSFRHLCSRVMRVSMRPAHGAEQNDRPRVAVMWLVRTPPTITQPPPHHHQSHESPIFWPMLLHRVEACAAESNQLWY